MAVFLVQAIAQQQAVIADADATQADAKQPGPVRAAGTYTPPGWGGAPSE